MDAGTIGAMVSFAVLGTFALLLVGLDRRGPATRAFAALLVGRGLAGLMNSMSGEANAFLAANAIVYLPAVSLAFVALIVRFAAVHPRPRSFLATRAGIAVSFAPAALAAIVGVFAPETFLSWDGGTPVRESLSLVSSLAPYIVLTAVAIHTLRLASIEAEPEVRRSLGLVPLAFFVDAAFAITLTASGAEARTLLATPLVGPAFAIAVVGFLALTASFAMHALRASSPLVGIARAAFMLAAAASLLAWVVTSGALGPVGSVVLRNIGRLPLAIVIAYALVRHRVFGIDLKIKVTIRQSTIAAVFVGVFFIVSELAQQVFQASTGPYVGIAAAGALVFAMAPLQRVAERVSEKAMPHVHDPRSGKVEDRIELYRQAYVLALADGILTEDEERHLAKLATMMSLSHETVFDIRRGVPTPT